MLLHVYNDTTDEMDRKTLYNVILIVKNYFFGSTSIQMILYISQLNLHLNILKIPVIRSPCFLLFTLTCTPPWHTGY